MVSEEEAQTILEHYDYKRKTEGKERKVAKDEIGNHYRGRLVKRKMDQEMLQHLVVEDMVEETKMEDSTLSKKRGHEEVITSSEITRDVKRLDGKVEREITTTM